MPLNSGTSQEAFQQNVETEIAAGKSQNQAVAIAYSEKRKSAKDGLSSRQYDGNGWMEVKGNPISKVGVFPYRGSSIDEALEPDKIYMVYRPAEELSKADCIDSFKLIPWIDLHPQTLLGPEFTGRLPAEKKGVHGVIGEDVFFDPSDGEGGMLKANLKLFSDALSDKIDTDGIREVSAGYGCTYEICSGVFNGKTYDVIQRNIRGNHLASVPEGRMGPDVAVLDHLTFTFDAKELTMPTETEEEKKMTAAKDRAAKDGFSRYAGDEDEKEKDGDTAKDGMMGCDEDEDKKDKDDDKKDEDKAAKDADEDDKDDEKKEKEMKDKKGMDAAISQLRGEVQTLKQSGIKSMIREVAKRDALANRISNFVGAFDHAEMTSEEVAQYGIKKLGLKCDKGSEMAALEGYMHNRKASIEEIGFALDASANNTGDSDAIANFFNSAA